MAIAHTPEGLVIATDIEVVKSTFAAFAARDVEAVLELVQPDVEFSAMTGEHAGRTDPYRGYGGMRQYFRDVATLWEDLRLTPRDFRAVDDLVLVTGRVSAHSGTRTITGSTGWVFRVRDGKVAYGKVYASAEDAIAAVEDGAA
jgi:ketosteroid isomerase-like protein